MRYLGVHFVKSRTLKCSLDAAKREFYRAANFGKIGRIASEEVVLQRQRFSASDSFTIMALYKFTYLLTVD